MSAVTIAAGASAQITVPQGQQIEVASGEGLAGFGYGPRLGQTMPIVGRTTIGPFTADQVVTISASRAITYDADRPLTAVALSQSKQVTDPATSLPVGGSGLAQSLGSVSGATTINLALGTNVALTVAGNITLGFTGLPTTGSALRAILTITNGGAGVWTYPGNSRFLGAGIVGSAPSFVASGTEKIAIDITNFAGTVAYDISYLGRVA